MDPVSAIVTALALGATVALKTATEQTVKDAYTGLRDLIRKRYAAVGSDLDQLEQTPDSKTRRAVIEEGLKRAAAQNDPELHKLAETLVARIKNQALEVTAATGIRAEDLQQVEVELGNIRVERGIGADFKNVGGGSIHVGDIDIDGDRTGKNL